MIVLQIFALIFIGLPFLTEFSKLHWIFKTRNQLKKQS
ncbi:MAG: hypothetical protein ACJA1Z_002174 [Patiriisocius sp.]|jgi:hypothetical protein